jgi:Ca2+-binding RTX toxin-like protein
MAIATAYHSVNMINAEVWYGDVTVATSSHIQVAYGPYVQNYYGNFIYSSYDLIGGTVTATDYYESGVKIYDITGGSYSAVTVANYLDAGDMNGLLSFIFFGNDTFNGSQESDGIMGYAGNDLIYGKGGDDYILGGTGNDTLSGGSGSDIFEYSTTNEGLDLITDFSSQDTIRINGLNMIGIATAGNGSSVGLNQVQVSSSGGVTTLYIGTNSTPGSDVTIQLTGTYSASQFVLAGNDITLGSVVGPTIYTFTGQNLVISDFQAGDILQLGSSASGIMSPTDFVIQQSGADLVFWNIATQSGITLQNTTMYEMPAEAIEFYTGSGYQYGLVIFGDGTTGTASDDLANIITLPSPLGANQEGGIAYGLGGDDSIAGTEANDFLQGNQGFDYLDGAGGDDIIRGGKDDDVVDGGTGNDRLYGDLGSDLVLGYDGNDLVRGGKGDDWVAGEAGNDTIMGDKGDDLVEGDLGNDLFVFAQDSGSDVIIDFENGIDLIDLSAYGITAFNQLNITDDPEGAIIDLGPTAGSAANLIGLYAISASQLDDGDFIFA